MTVIPRLILSLLVLTILNSVKTFSQPESMALHENKFIQLYSKIGSFIPEKYDSLIFYSGKFETEFANFINSNPTSLNYPFKKLVDSIRCNVETSSDGNFRIYSWDAQTGGTMRTFRTIYQWKSNGKVFAKVPKYDESDPGSFCSKIFTVSIHDKFYYLAVTNGIYSTKDAMQSISAYSIVGNKLVDTVKLFKTKIKKLNSIDVGFDFFSVVDRPDRPLELIVYDDKQKIIYIPVVGDKGQVTKKNILYQLKDRYFEFIGIETGMRN